MRRIFMVVKRERWIKIGLIFLVGLLIVECIWLQNPSAEGFVWGGQAIQAIVISLIITGGTLVTMNGVIYEKNIQKRGGTRSHSVVKGIIIFLPILWFGAYCLVDAFSGYGINTWVYLSGSWFLADTYSLFATLLVGAELLLGEAAILYLLHQRAVRHLIDRDPNTKVDQFPLNFARILRFEALGLLVCIGYAIWRIAYLAPVDFMP